MLEIVKGHVPASLPAVRELFEEYVAAFGFHLTFRDVEQEMADLAGRYGPADGCLLMALWDDQPAGCVAMKKLRDGVCEMKRNYVRSAFRGHGIGRHLIKDILFFEADITAGMVPGVEKYLAATLTFSNAALY